jgi:NAD(P)-dependent dehydrogenase (short-subunit alcohol dehydrogenase family)
MTTRKSIFITGGGSGIGRAVAQHFAAKGWFVGLADINKPGLAESAALLPAGGSSQHVLDVRDRLQWKAALADFATASGGRLDVLFNNAGVGHGGPFAEVTHANHDMLVDVNFKGVMYGAEAGFDLLKQTPGSCLLNTASAAAIYGGPGLAVYAATKFAVRGLTESLDQEWQAHDIKVRSLMPSFIDTPLLDGASAGTNLSVRETVREAGLEFTPLEEVAQKAWDAVHGKNVHMLVGKTARRLSFAVRWMPWLIKGRMRGPEAKPLV